MKPIIEAKELQEIYASEHLILVDAGNGENARKSYNSQHLAKAIFLDLNTELSAIKEDFAQGGRHPLPSIQSFLKLLSAFGISADKHIVVYDTNYGANAAARFWWMLKAIGHEKVQVLNGGLQAALKANLPMSSEIPVNTGGIVEYQGPIEWKLPVISIQEIEQQLNETEHLLVDVREAKRYNGEVEPIDLIAGHIPGAVNVPFSENLDGNGLFLEPDKLKKKYESLFQNIPTNKIAFHCGSGVTACHSLLAIAHAGLAIPKLYVGSWSEWSRNNKPMVTR